MWICCELPRVPPKALLTPQLRLRHAVIVEFFDRACSRRQIVPCWELTTELPCVRLSTEWRVEF